MFVPVTITANHVEDVAKKFRGSAGLGGLDANNLSNFSCDKKKPARVYAMKLRCG